MNARDHAVALADYFGGIPEEFGGSRFEKGLKTAQEWLRLIDAETVTPAELTALLGVIHANRFEGHGWYDLALSVYHWALQKGFPVPEWEEFFKLDFDPTGQDKILPTSVAAAKIVAYFELRSREDPTDEEWSIGLQLAKHWLDLTETLTLDKPQVSAFASVFGQEHKDGSQLWYYFSVYVYTWCNDLGYPDLVPPGFRK